MVSPRSSAAHASVAFLKLRGFTQASIAEQAKLSARLEEVLVAALPTLRDDERIVLEAPEGAAVIVLANPLGALRFARAALKKGGDLPLAIGLVHGPVRVADGDAQLLHGDALATAEAISAFPRDRSAAASRDFRDALAYAAPDAARHLPAAGAFVDALDRSHDLFHVDEAASARHRQRFFTRVGFAAAAILVVGGALRMAGIGREPPPGMLVFNVTPAGEILVNGVSKGSSPPLKSIQLPPGKHKIEIRSARHPPVVMQVNLTPGEELAVEHTFVTRPGMLVFDVKPAGEILVNGVSKGRSPPLKSLQLPPGKHEIEIRSARHPPVVMQLDLASGEELAVEHTFAATQPRQPSKPAWRRFVDKFK